jgi:hypothetical protein
MKIVEGGDGVGESWPGGTIPRPSYNLQLRRMAYDDMVTILIPLVSVGAEESREEANQGHAAAAS